MLPVIQIGPLALQVPGLLLLLGLWLGLNLAEKYAPRRGVDPALLSNLTLIALLAGLVGSRLSYAARYPSAFAASPLSLVSLNTGLLDPLGGAATSVLAALIYGNRKNMRLLPTLDAIAPLLAVMLLASGLANLASGNAFGSPTSLPFGIDLWGAKRHPTQIYETLAAVVILGIFWPDRKRFLSWKPGEYFFSIAASAAAARLFLEAFRADSVLTQNGLRLVQLAAWMILAICLLALIWINRTTNQPLENSRDT